MGRKVVTVFACVMGLSACSAADSSVRMPMERPNSTVSCTSFFCHIGTDPAIVVHDLEPANLGSLKARLSWLEKEACLVAVADGRTVVPVWPRNTTPVRASDGRRGVNAPGRGEILEGDTFEQGGSWIAGAEVGQTCGGHDEFFAVDSFES
ncbi:hypothetical protein [Herbidospora cretacea]|uniref:hypothetical protein n=1 Tax=Herbidospora cretacea TaxID=28444 RepID=UPI0012FA9226|nr:hypothetical protein [Herbidospora cretacea]